jgi:hypothetical protein
VKLQKAERMRPREIPLSTRSRRGNGTESNTQNG